MQGRPPRDGRGMGAPDPRIPGREREIPVVRSSWEVIPNGKKGRQAQHGSR